MRVNLPKEICDLIPCFEKYIQHSAERGCYLTQDAPQEAKVAYENYVKWMRENASDRV